MSQYALVYRNGGLNLSPAEMQHHLAECQLWFEGLLEKGLITDPGIPLGSADSAVVGKNKVVYDGPFAEAKDVIGGLTILSVSDLAEAIEIAKTCPVVDVGGSVEVRPVQNCAP